MTSEASTPELEDDAESSEDWIPDQLGPEPFFQYVMEDQISDPDEFLEKLWHTLCEIEENIGAIPLAKGAARDFQIDAITDALHEMGATLVIGRTSYARACEGQERFAMVVAKIFFKLGYLCHTLELFAAPLSDAKRSDTLFGLADIGRVALQQRRIAGQARVQAEMTQKAATKKVALDFAIKMRADRPNVSQEDIAKAVKTTLGNVVPKEGSIVKWIQAWERDGDLPRPPNRQ